MKKLRKNNKGFSLVELIIVIAIMAALVAILAPQYLKYVERSRESADKTTLDNVITAVKVAVTDTETLGSDDITITWTKGADGKTFSIGTQTANTPAAVVQTSVVAALGNSGAFVLKSVKGTAQATYAIKVDVAGKTFDVSMTPTLATAFPAA